MDVEVDARKVLQYFIERRDWHWQEAATGLIPHMPTNKETGDLYDWLHDHFMFIRGVVYLDDFTDDLDEEIRYTAHYDEFRTDDGPCSAVHERTEETLRWIKKQLVANADQFKPEE